MPARLQLFNRSSAALKNRHCCCTPKSVSHTPAAQQRWITAREKPLPTTDQQQKGPNQDQLPHVSEEAAAVDKIMGEEGPDIEQGTPVQDILARDSDGQEKLPKVMQDDMKKKKAAAGGSRSYSTSVRRNATDDLEMSSLSGDDGGSSSLDLPPSMMMTYKDIPHQSAGSGHKFGLPAAPLARTDHLKRRYDPIIEQLTRALMRHGKLSAAQRTVEDILDTVRTAPPPQQKSSRPGQALLPSAGPINLLPLSPIKYLASVFDSVAPLIKIRQQKGIAGGGQSLPIPIPIGLKLRRRTAMKWILHSADKRIESKLADRVAREIINVAEGTSSAWEKRSAVHKSAVTARVNVKAMLNRPRSR